MKSHLRETVRNWGLAKRKAISPMLFVYVSLNIFEWVVLAALCLVVVILVEIYRWIAVCGIPYSRVSMVLTNTPEKAGNATTVMNQGPAAGAHRGR